MNLLIVDDDYLIVGEIEAGMDWVQLGIDNLYTAFNIRQAKKIIEANTIDIVFCDIEMPRGSGLQLLSWARENQVGAEFIFLTCHMNFSFAQEALRLGSLDFILKPVQFDELRLALEKAMKKIRRRNYLTENSRLWIQSFPQVLERFWYDILNRRIPLDPQAIEKAAKERSISYHSRMKFLPVFLSIRRWNSSETLHDHNLLEFGLKNVASETIIKQAPERLLIELGQGKFMIIISLPENQAFSMETLQEDCNACISACHMHLECDLSFYIGEEFSAPQAPAMVERLTDMEKHNLAFENKVLLLGAQSQPHKTAAPPNMHLWFTMLTDGAGERMLAEVFSYLQSFRDTTGADTRRLNRFYHDFTQIIYSGLKQKGIQAQEILDTPRSLELCGIATRSVVDMMAWIRYVVEQTEECLVESKGAEVHIAKAKEYISLNIGQEISRDEVAHHLHLNPDYLDRIFKREEGLSVTKFIQQERILIASELLIKTEIPVSRIASSVGYSNFSYFSSVFKKQTKMSPMYYRKATIEGRAASICANSI